MRNVKAPQAESSKMEEACHHAKSTSSPGAAFQFVRHDQYPGRPEGSIDENPLFGVEIRCRVESFSVCDQREQRCLQYGNTQQGRGRSSRIAEAPHKRKKVPERHKERPHRKPIQADESKVGGYGPQTRSTCLAVQGPRDEERQLVFPQWSSLLLKINCGLLGE